MQNQARPLRMIQKLPGLVNDYWQNLWEGKRAGKLVAWCSGASPHQVLMAMDFEVAWPEGYAGLCSAGGFSGDLCQRAETIGYSPDLCSVLRNAIGSTHGTPVSEMQKLPYGGLPKPDLLLCQPYCPGIYKMWKMYSEYFNVPLLVMERGRIHDALTEDVCALLVQDGIDELREIIAYLERLTGRCLDYDRLAQRMALEWEANRVRMEGMEMCRSIPAPMSMFDVFTTIFPFYLHRGTQTAVDYYQELKDEVAERLANNQGSLIGEEKYRLYWDNLPIFYKSQEIIEKFASYGAVPVVAAFPYVFAFLPDLDMKNPLKAAVEYTLLNPANRGLKGRIDFIQELVDGFTIDGLVMQRSRTCLMFNMGQDDITEALVKKTGLPAVVVEGDLCDPRFYSDAEFNGKVDAFMEILAQRG